MNCVRINSYNTRMTSISISLHPDLHRQMRPLNVFRDLPAVADLIELCFSSSMDMEGKQYLQDMRRAGGDRSFLRWASRAAESASLPLSGYVWEEDHRIVGNASLVPFRHKNKRLYLIANIAVHPDARRRGIARALTVRAMQHAREKRVDSVWLHVRDDNPHAHFLYSGLGFVELAKRTSWQAATDLNTPALRTELSITSRQKRFWPIQQQWLSDLYPEALSWYRHWDFHRLAPGLWNQLVLFLTDANIRQWAAIRGNSLESVLTWIPYGRGESLFIAAGEASDPDAVPALLLRARRDLFHIQSHITLEAPAGQFDGLILSAGFQKLRTLVWMQATL
jgi:ribosomal protein S18 acetylase RimI-like enzyme